VKARSRHFAICFENRRFHSSIRTHFVHWSLTAKVLRRIAASRSLATALEGALREQLAGLATADSGDTRVRVVNIVIFRQYEGAVFHGA